MEDGTNRTEYVYDGNGNRVGKIINGVRTTYVNDPNRDYTQVLAELSASGTQTSRYTNGLERISGLMPGQANPLLLPSLTRWGLGRRT